MYMCYVYVLICYVLLFLCFAVFMFSYVYVLLWLCFVMDFPMSGKGIKNRLYANILERYQA